MRFFRSLVLAVGFALALVPANADIVNPPPSNGPVSASRMPAFTGDCSTSAGAVATTCSTMGGVIPGAPKFKVHLVTSQSLSSGVFTKILFDTVDFDTGPTGLAAVGNWSTVNHNYNPQTAGTYLVCMGVSSSSTTPTTGDNLFVSLSLNGTTYIQAEPGTLSTSTMNIPAAGCAPVFLNGTTDKVEVDINLTATTPIVRGSSTSNTYFSATRVGP